MPKDSKAASHPSHTFVIPLEPSSFFRILVIPLGPLSFRTGRKPGEEPAVCRLHHSSWGDTDPRLCSAQAVSGRSHSTTREGTATTKACRNMEERRSSAA